MKRHILLPIIFLGIFPLFAATAGQAGGPEVNSPLAQTAPQTKFSDLVRADFFAGMMGDTVRFDRAMRLCETTLASDPHNPEALVWHGSGLLVRSDQARKSGDVKQSEALFQKGLDEMDQAVALAPDNLRVLLPQGATLLSVSQAPLPLDLKSKLLHQGVQDYEKVLKLQAAYFDTLPLHARGELLSGLADGWHRLGDEDKAREYYERIIKDCPGTSYATKSELLLQSEPPPVLKRTCQGCH